MDSTASRERRFGWLSALILALTCGAHAQASERDLDKFVADEMQRWAIPGLAVAVVSSDRIVFAKGYGLRQIDRVERVDEHTAFGIGSVTKSFTATAAAMLADDGKLAWDAPIIDFVPTLHLSDPWLTAHATVRDLASHRLGIDEPAIYLVHGGNIEQTTSAVRYMRQALPFRTFLYSNTGYAMLGQTVARASGMSWDDFIATRIFKPLGMNESYPSEHSFIDPAWIANCWLCEAPAGAPLGRDALRDPKANMAVPHGLVAGANPRGAVATRASVVPWRSERTVASTGLIYSSVHDMAQYMLMHLGRGEYRSQRLLSEAQSKQIHSAQAVMPDSNLPGFRTEGYGMGWIVGTYRGRPASQHSGGRVGFGSHVWLFPEQKLGVVVLQNLDFREAPVFSHISSRFADRFLGLTHEHDETIHALASKPTILSARQGACAASNTNPAAQNLQRYAGSYRNEVVGGARIVIDGDHPVLSFEGGASADLRAQADGFVMCFRGHEPWPTPLTFTFDATGTPNGFDMGTVEQVGPLFLRFQRTR